MLNKSFFCALLLSLSNLTEAQIIESDDITHLLTHIDEKSLVIFDLDNTLIEPKQLLGSDQWVGYKINHLIASGIDPQEAVEQVVTCWFSVLSYSEMVMVDPRAHEVLSTLHEQGIGSIGLTKRDPLSCALTLGQLEKLGVQFQPTHPLENTHLFNDSGLYQEGVIFVSRTADKGNSLIAYLNHLPNHPQSIIVIDDKLSHLKSLEEAAATLGIRFVGIRYSALDEKINNFDPQVAEIELKQFHESLRI